MTVKNFNYALAFLRGIFVTNLRTELGCTKATMIDSYMQANKDSPNCPSLTEVKATIQYLEDQKLVTVDSKGHYDLSALGTTVLCIHYENQEGLVGLGLLLRAGDITPEDLRALDHEDLLQFTLLMLDSVVEATAPIGSRKRSTKSTTESQKSFTHRVSSLRPSDN